MRKLIIGLFFSMMLFTWFIDNVAQPAVDTMKEQFNSAVIDPFAQLGKFANDPTSIPFE